MFEEPRELEAALRELRKLGTSMYRNAEGDARFEWLYLELLKHYESIDKLAEFDRFCQKHLAVAQHCSVMEKIWSQSVTA